MTYLPEHWHEKDEEWGSVHIKPASEQAVGIVLSADPRSDEGRSQWVWVRLPNGDLVLGVFPQSETYLAASELDEI